MYWFSGVENALSELEEGARLIFLVVIAGAIAVIGSLATSHIIKKLGIQ